MGRQALHNVTNVLPILIPQNGEESHGWIGLPPGRMVSVVCAPEKAPALRPDVRKLAEALSLLRVAISGRNAEQIAKAVEASVEWVPLAGISGKVTFHFDKPLSGLIVGAKCVYSNVANFALQDTRTVIWSANNGLRPPIPGLFCPDEQIAYLARTLLSPATVRLCADPRCRVPFTPSNRRHVYHVPACRVRALRSRV